MFDRLLLGLVLLVAGADHASADVLQKLRLDWSATFSRIEQQAKVEVGAPRGERLVEQTELGTEMVASAAIWGPLSAGVFAQLDLGTRRAARFDGFDAQGATMTTDQSGGPYQEIWIGPVLRAHYRFVVAELGYGLVTFRNDSGRDDLPSSTGDRSSAFRTLPSERP